MRVLLRVLANLMRVLLSPLRLAKARSRRRQRHDWVYLRLPRNIAELRVPPTTLRQKLTAAKERHKLSTLEALRELAAELERDSDVPGICLHVSRVQSGWATCESIRELLLRIRASGKRVVCYLSEGGGNSELFVASAADRVVLVPYSWLGPFGFASQSIYFKRLLTRVGVRFDVHATGPYKSAAEPFVLDAMSDAAREQQGLRLQGLQSALERALCEARGLTPEALQALFKRGILAAQEALQLGLVDAVCYEDELRRNLGDTAATSGPLRPWRDASAYLRERSYRMFRPLRDAPYVGVISISGAIADKGSRFARAADRGTITATLRQAAGDRNVRAVVLHINSPGGSAFASELIHHEVERLARSKPVIAYVGDIAASGGYYVAAPCHRIVARPLSITGSIGVVSAKPAISDMLEHIGISPQTLRTAPHADMFSTVRPQSASEKEVWQEHTQELYTRFLDIVATGRKRPVADIEAIAGGRVWSGQEASDNGLVDALGGMERAFELAREAIKGLSPEEGAELSLRPIRAKSAGDAPPPAADPLPTPARLLSELDPDLAFLLSAEREPGAYYACGLSQLLDVDAAPPSLDTVMLLSFVQSCGAGAVSAALAQAVSLPAPTAET